MTQTDPTAPQRVLLIDDEVMIHHLVRARLAGERIELHTADNAVDGVVVATKVRPDLILLDVELAGPDQCIDGCTDGYEVCRQLQADPSQAGAQIIFLSAHATAQERTRGLDLGAVDFVAKPFDPSELRARVRAALRTKRLLDMLATRAMLDGLTGLWNRAFLNERLASEAARANRYGTPLSLILLDVDRFKSINDRFGHPFGDDVLRHVAAALNAASRVEDVVCRHGGEEFAVVAAGSDLYGATTLAERLRQGVRGMPLATTDGQRVTVTGSFGVAVARRGDTPATLMGRADQSLYRAKQTGRDRVVSLDGDDVAALAAAG